MINNYCDLYTFSLDSRRYYTEAQHQILSLGLCLETFYAKINHSCQPNAYWCFNGRELQVRAEHNIQAGTELSISYISGGDYKERKEQLNKWGFDCSCRLCSKGEIGLRGSARTTLDKIFKAAHVEGISTREKLALSEKGISELKRAGWGFDADEMREADVGDGRHGGEQGAGESGAEEGEVCEEDRGGKVIGGGAEDCVLEEGDEC